MFLPRDESIDVPIPMSDQLNETHVTFVMLVISAHIISNPSIQGPLLVDVLDLWVNPLPVDYVEVHFRSDTSSYLECIKRKELMKSVVRTLKPLMLWQKQL